MIRGVHAMFYSSEANELRDFLRDKLQLPHTDVGEGWLIFDIPTADLGVHPTDPSSEESLSGRHSISFYTDDLDGTVAALSERGVGFTDEIEDRGYARVIHFSMPGGVEVELYQPRYQKRSEIAPGLAAPAVAAKKTAKKTVKKAAKKTAKKRTAKKSPAKAKPKVKAKPAAKAKPRRKSAR